MVRTVPLPLAPAKRISRSSEPTGVMPDVATAVPVPDVADTATVGATPPDTATRMAMPHALP